MVGLWSVLIEADAGKTHLGKALKENSDGKSLTLVPSTLSPRSRVVRSVHGSDRLQEGMFESVFGGTIFLDEFAEMSSVMHVRLLRSSGS